MAVIVTTSLLLLFVWRGTELGVFLLTCARCSQHGSLRPMLVPSAFSLSHNAVYFAQGVIDLEALGKKGYSVPKAGTIQVVSHPLACSSTVGMGLVGLWLPCWGGYAPCC